MISRDWDWSAIVSPKLVEHALAEQERRAQRRALRADADAASREPDHRPVAA